MKDVYRLLLLILKIGPRGIMGLIDTDYLTGVFNLRGFERILETEKKRVCRYGGVFTLLYCDLDDLKRVNDSQGHKAGDELIVGFVRDISKYLRQTDIISRIGGDEFTILLPNTSEEEGRTLAFRLQRRLNVSIGICDSNEKGDIVAIANRRMQANKKIRKAGKN